MGKIVNLNLFRLRNSQKIKYLIANGKFKFFKSVTLLLLNFILAWFLANYLTSNDYGEYLTLVFYLGVISIFSMPGAKDSLTHSISNGFEGTLSRSLFLRLKNSLLGTMIFFLLAIFFYNNSNLFFSFLLLTILSPFLYAFENLTSYYTGAENFKGDFYLTSIIEFCKLVFLVSLVFMGANIVVLIVGFILSHLLPSLFSYISINKKLKNNKIDGGFNKYSKFLTKISVFVIFSNYVDKLLLTFFFSPAILANYTVTTMLQSKLKPLMRPLLYTFFPKFSQKEFSISKVNLLVVFIASFFMAILMAIVTPFFIFLFFPGYFEYSILGVLYSLTLIFLPCNTLLEFYFKSDKNHHAIRQIVIIPKLVSWIIMTILLFLLGLKGLVIGIVIESFLSFLLGFYYWRKFYGEK